MTKARLLSPEDRRFLCAVKESLLVPHSGLAPLPRKVAAAAMNRSESFYSRMTDQAQLECIPDMVDLRRYIAGTGNLEPIRVLQTWVGEAEQTQGEINPFRLLAACEEASGAFNTHLSKLIADGDLSRADAMELVPWAAGLMQQAQSAMDLLRKRARRA